MTNTWDWPGSKWWKVDLHTHSPASHDYKYDGADRENKWVQWLEAAKAAQLDAVAVTDHNTAEGVKHLQEAAKNLSDAPVIFPGVELTASDGTHLLLILDPEQNHEHVSDLLSRVALPLEERGTHRARSRMNVENILDKIGNEAVVIAAHANSKTEENTKSVGLLTHYGERRIAELRNPALMAVEIDPDFEVNESWLNGSKPEIGRTIPQVWGSDSHSLTAAGRRFTWVKMTSPTIDGLRLALIDGDQLSLQPAGKDHISDPNHHATSVIESITISSLKHMGRPKPLRLEFNPRLNAIIGGRGTGKSTVVDLCRKLMRRDAELKSIGEDSEGSLKQQYDTRMQIPAGRVPSGLLTEDSSAKIVFRKDGYRYSISWSASGVADPIALLEDGKAITQAGDIAERFPVRIYSQKQLFELAQQPNALLTLIDDSPHVKGPDIERQLRRLHDDYLSLRAEARAARTRAAEVPAARASLADVQRQLDVLQKSGHADILQTYRTRHQVNHSWHVLADGVTSSLETVRTAVESLAVPDLRLASNGNTDLASEALRSCHGELARIIQTFQSAILEELAQVLQRIDSIRAGVSAAEWEAAVNASEEEYRRVSAQLAEQAIANPTDYRELLDGLQELTSKITALEDEQGRSDQLEQRAAVTLANYRKLLEDRYALRQAFAAATSGDTIRIEVNLFAAIPDLAARIGELFGIETFQDDRNAIAERIAPRSGDSWEWGRLDDEVDAILAFQSGKTETWQTKRKRFERALSGVPPERLDRLSLLAPDDSLTIHFRPHPNEGAWKPISQGSPGQQTASLLAFVLGYGSEPIILDQPEDDLDNTLVYDLLVQRLRESKASRQVIVVTHNPNIVVHGDAELVISLDVRHDQTNILHQRGLQEREIREEVCRVMEGGQEAFQARYRRIMPVEAVR